MIVSWRWQDGKQLTPVYGYGPWWLALWFKVCGWFDAHYWRAYQELRK